MTAADKDLPPGLRRTLFTFANLAQDGAQNLGWLFQLVGIFSSVYVALTISHVLVWLPYWAFLAVSVLLVGIPLFAVLGFVYQFMVGIYQVGLDIQVKASQYSLWKITPRDRPYWLAMGLFMRGMAGLPVDRAKAAKAYADIENILEKNGIGLE